jgi:DNA-directed RNA polymerase
MNKIKNRNATMPNLIHSLDAASLTLLFDTFYRVVKANNHNINFYSVHDCYGVTAPYVETLITQLRSVYIKLYSKELYIKTFEEDVLGEIFKAYSNDIIYDKNNRILYIKKSKGNEMFKLPKFPYNIDDDKRNKHYDDFKKGMLFIK